MLVTVDEMGMRGAAHEHHAVEIRVTPGTVAVNVPPFTRFFVPTPVIAGRSLRNTYHGL